MNLWHIRKYPDQFSDAEKLEMLLATAVLTKNEAQILLQGLHGTTLGMQQKIAKAIKKISKGKR